MSVWKKACELLEELPNFPQDRELVFKLLSANYLPFSSVEDKLLCLACMIYLRGDGELIEGFDSPLMLYVRVDALNAPSVEEVWGEYESRVRVSPRLAVNQNKTIVGDLVEVRQSVESVYKRVQSSLTLAEFLSAVGGFVKEADTGVYDMSYRLNPLSVKVDQQYAVLTVSVMLRRIKDRELKTVESEVSVSIPYLNPQNQRVFAEGLLKLAGYYCQNAPNYVSAGSSHLLREYQNGVLANEVAIFSSEEEFERLKARIETLEGVSFYNHYAVFNSEEGRFTLGGGGFIAEGDYGRFVYIKGKHSKEEAVKSSPNEQVTKFLSIYDYRTSVEKSMKEGG